MKTRTPSPIEVDRLRQDLAAHGLFLRGAFSFGSDEAGPDGSPALVRSIVLVGPVGGSLWSPFRRWRATQSQSLADPLDRWSKAVVGGIATAHGAVAFYPSDRPYQPFQQWAMRAEGLSRSPLGILIHPQHGLWHAYRAALGFCLPWPEPEPAWHPPPCQSCAGKPCGSACPAGAVTATGFDAATCHAYVTGTVAGSHCIAAGCQARNACPVGAALRYPPEQLRFHMEAMVGR
ncbi:ferredoxin [Ensifer soli]|uniref:ferredoxin n=1 Tax=Ciceribacter sp. sgz301302 TaxID=3342379 RepID=UPI0035B7FBCD